MKRHAFSVIVLATLVLLTACQAQVWYPGWKEGSALTIARAGAATVVANGHIYMIGGVDGRDFLATTESAKINADGSLGPWQSASLLNEPRGFTDAVVHNGYIYIVGGGNGPNGQALLRSTERAKLESDGSLGPWEIETSQMVMPRRCSKLVVTEGVLYAFGGFGGTLLDTVEAAPLVADGHLGAWRIQDQTLTMPRYVNGVKALDGKAYVIGGHDQMRGVGITAVEWAPLPDTGQIQGWSPTSPLKAGRYGLASTAHGHELYALGGLSGLEYLAGIEVATTSAQGLSAWHDTTPLTVPRASFSAVVYKDWIYVLGGTNAEGYLTSTEYATFNGAGDIGLKGSALEAEAYRASQMARAQQQPDLPNVGVVQEIRQASMYSYIRVSGPAGEQWLAGPKVDIAPGSRIRYSKGVSMTHFYSKELQQSFPAILFVSQIRAEH